MSDDFGGHLLAVVVLAVIGEVLATPKPMIVDNIFFKTESAHGTIYHDT